MLCALVRGQHCQTLHLMILGQVFRDSDTSYIFCIHQLVNNLPLSEHSLFYLYQDMLLIVHCVLVQFLMNIFFIPTSLRGEEQQLFISHVKPHHGVSKDTISRWIRSVM